MFNERHVLKFVLQPWQLTLLTFAGWINQRQQEAIEYLKTENSVLREKLGKKRICLMNVSASDWQSKVKSLAASV